ncbi:hypothetical protein NEIRO03_0578 [Nematocida sp. AWRm78]|nr:hypothetical protein NEIRO02_0557 [Nematocida sp. AWRm79]KAI5182943.1 hypothetical protein NEIRO03_0578 [Nematocida sp. AWRm78]
MGHSVWYLENRDMCKVIPTYIVKKEKPAVVAESIIEVDFDLTSGPSVLNKDDEMTEKEESAFAFSSLPDIRSMEMGKESFIFYLSNKSYHVSFIQEADKSKPRGCTQKSIVVQCSKHTPALPLVLSDALTRASEYTPEKVLNLLWNTELPTLTETIRILHNRISPEIQKLLDQNKNTIIENLMRSKGFLVIARTPTESSVIVCYLSMFGRVKYGGDILPYRSSFVQNKIPNHSIVGVTNEYHYKSNQFDNAIDAINGRYYYKEKKCNDNLEKLFKELEEYFLECPEGFQTEKWLHRLSDLGASIKARRVFREFFGSSGFTEWLLAHGYKSVQPNK